MPGLVIAHFGLKRQYGNLRDELLDATDRALKDGQLVGGHYTRSFEEWLKSRCQTKYAITVHSGSQALEIIARWKKEIHDGLETGFSARIRIPNLTYPATLNSFLNAGWAVELCDTDRYGIILDYPSTRTSSQGLYHCLVGLYGRMPWAHALYNDAYGLIVDGAQHWLIANGNVGSGMAISFDPTKNLPSSGNGGAIVTNNESLYKFATNYRDNGILDKFSNIGTNSKMSEQDCAQLLVRTHYIDRWQERRSKIAKYWCDKFKDLPIRCMSDTTAPHAHQKFVLYLPDRSVLQRHLLAAGIDVKVHYDYVLGDLPIAADLVKPDMLSTSVMLSRGVISLPLYPELTDQEVIYITGKVRSCYK